MRRKVPGDEQQAKNRAVNCRARLEPRQWDPDSALPLVLCCLPQCTGQIPGVGGSQLFLPALLADSVKGSTKSPVSARLSVCPSPSLTAPLLEGNNGMFLSFLLCETGIIKHFCGAVPGGASGEVPAYQFRGIRDVSSIPGLGGSPGEGHGHPLQCSCLENPKDRGAWRATINGVAESWTRMK